MLVLDDARRILREYQDQFRQASSQPGPGRLFLKWVHNNQAIPALVELVRLDVRSAGNPGPDAEDFVAFPDDPELGGFDRSDRRFVAVALASRHAPEILNAVDTDGGLFRRALQEYGVQIRFVCPGQFAEHG